MSIQNDGKYKFESAKAKELATLGVRVPKQGIKAVLEHRLECLKSGVDLIHLHESKFNPAQVERSKRTLADLRTQIVDTMAMMDRYIVTARRRSAA
ncbi:MAG: hypothetical protein GY943_24300 [Chloroflexi bacterium]|nr:hypothetical protein [Chloroflexota bacterium]